MFKLSQKEYDWIQIKLPQGFIHVPLLFIISVTYLQFPHAGTTRSETI